MFKWPHRSIARFPRKVNLEYWVYIGSKSKQSLAADRLTQRFLTRTSIPESLEKEAYLHMV